MAEILTGTETLETKKNEKLCELGNLISQYEAGVRDTLNADEYPTWVTITEMLKSAEIDEDIFDGFVSNPEKYKIENGKIVFNENWQADLELAEKKRIAKLHMTKLDFYTYVLKANEISYAQLLQVLNADEDLAATWDLCNHVFRGNEQLNAYIFKQIPTMTEEKLTQIFEEHGTSEND